MASFSQISVIIQRKKTEPQPEKFTFGEEKSMFINASKEDAEIITSKRKQNSFCSGTIRKIT